MSDIVTRARAIVDEEFSYFPDKARDLLRECAERIEGDTHFIGSALVVMRTIEADMSILRLRFEQLRAAFEGDALAKEGVKLE